MVINIILAILVLSIIIIIHEFGHFIVAKANGITVVEFSLGFGPKLIHFKKGETEYSLKLLPFGGACIMLGEDFLEADDDEQEDATEGNNTGKSGSELDNDFCNGKTAEDTLRNMGLIASPGMVETEKTIIDILKKKQEEGRA